MVLDDRLEYNFILQMGAQNEKQEILEIKIISGEAQSQELFDFQSEKKEECLQILQFPSKLAHSAETGIVYMHQQSQNQQYETIFHIRKQLYHQITFQSVQEVDFHNQIWRVISGNQKFPLYEGDQLKLGKIKIKLKTIITQSPTLSRYPQKQETQQLSMSFKNQNYVKIPQEPCRVCFDGTESQQNPLLSLCKCIGSVKNIHFECLKDWINNNIQRHESPNCLSYTYIEAKCQICKEKYDNQFYHNGNKFMLYEFQKLQPPYALFENLNLDENPDKNKISVFMIKLEQGKVLSVGRNTSSEVVLSDISVSRSHCSFIYERGQLFVQDRKSKFGTLIMPTGSWEFEGREGLKVQIGPKLVCINQQKILEGCCCPSKPYQFRLQQSNLDASL